MMVVDWSVLVDHKHFRAIQVHVCILGAGFDSEGTLKKYELDQSNSATVSDDDDDDDGDDDRGSPK